MSVVTRTNLATNPSAGTNATNYAAVPGTGGTAAVAWNSGAGYQNIPGYPRVTWSVATTAVSGGISYTATGLAANTQYATQIWVRCSKAQTVNLKADFRNSSNTIVNTVTGSNVTLAANTWTQLIANGASGAAVTNAVFTAQAVTGGSNWAVNDWFDGEAICVEAPTVARTNLSTNPAVTDLSSITTNAGGTTPTLTRVATGGPLSGVSAYAHATISAIATSIQINQDGTGMNSSSPGQSYSASGYVRSSLAATPTVYVQWLDNAGATLSTVSTVGAALAANTWTLQTFAAGAAPAGAVRARVIYRATASYASGDFLDASAFLFEPASSPGGYFDGNTPNTTSMQNGWTGTSGLSTSVQWAGSSAYFDGGTVNANSVMYAWTGTANASTSTAKTYTPVISLNPRTDAPCPRVEVTITDVTPTDNVITVWRTADGVRQAVRGARRWTVNGSNYVVDYEVPLGRSVSYDVEVTSGLNLGAGITQQTTTITTTTWWIQDPLVPSSAIAVNVSKQDSSKPYLTAAAVRSLEYAAGVSIVPILGASQPVALMGQRLAAAGVDFSMFTNTATVTTQLRNLLQQTPLLLVRPNGVRNNGVPGLAYYSAAKPQEHPVTVAFGGTLTNWALTGDLVAAPAMNVLVPVWTYGSVAALWATYQQAQTALSAKTYLDVLKSPSGT